MQTALPKNRREGRAAVRIAHGGAAAASPEHHLGGCGSAVWSAQCGAALGGYTPGVAANVIKT
jgi:hypothetical protein